MKLNHSTIENKKKYYNSKINDSYNEILSHKKCIENLEKIENDDFLKFLNKNFKVDISGYTFETIQLSYVFEDAKYTFYYGKIENCTIKYIIDDIERYDVEYQCVEDDIKKILKNYLKKIRKNKLETI